MFADYVALPFKIRVGRLTPVAAGSWLWESLFAAFRAGWNALTGVKERWNFDEQRTSRRHVSRPRGAYRSLSVGNL